MKDKLVGLFGLRSIITLSLTATLIYGFIAKMIPTDKFLEYVTMVFIFFFAKREQENNVVEEVKQKKDEVKGVG